MRAVILRSQPDSLFSILLMSEAEILVAVVRLLRGLHAHNTIRASPDAAHAAGRTRRAQRSARTHARLGTQEGKRRECAQRALVCGHCLLYTSPSPRDATLSRMPSSA